jgi:hypothetical protein
MGRRIRYSPSVLANAGLSPHAAPDPLDPDDQFVRGEGDGDGDNYGDKLTKYVPAEVLAFFIAASPVADSDPLRWTVVLVAMVINVFVMVDRKSGTRWTPFLACIAFLVWAQGTTDYGEQLLGLSTAASSILLISTVFLVPLIDDRLTAKFQR